ncbi:MAG: hypothetical protein AAGL98_03090, partial [Planctomycetota bacterium]
LWLIVGCAAAPPEVGLRGPAPRKKTAGFALVGAGLIAAILILGMGMYVAGVARHESAMQSAAAALRRGDTPRATERLEIAQHAAGWDTTALRWRVRLHAIEPMGGLVRAGREPTARRRVDEALAWIEDAVNTHGTPPTVARLRAQLLARWALATGDRPQDITAAMQAYDQLRPLSPYNVQDAWMRADLAYRLGDLKRAQTHFREVLRLREQMYLDPADPLTAGHLETALTVSGRPEAE